MGLLGEIFSQSDRLKRRIRGLLDDPIGTVDLNFRRAAEDTFPRRGDTPEQAVQKVLGMGTALTFGGPNAKTADILKLDRAKQMAKAGADPVDIWKTTGWTDQFPDRMWRFEIDDRGAIPRSPSWGAAEDLKRGNVTTDIRQRVFSHPKLSAAYPDTKRMGTTLNPRAGDSGSYRQDYDLISVGVENGKPYRPTMLHELQHAVQQREGFARGGSPEGLPQALQQDVGKLRKAARKAFDSDQRDTGLALEQKARELEHMAMWGESAPHELYKRLAGEAEARLVQQRMNLTPEERLARPPWLEFDVPIDQQIVRGLLDALESK